MGYVFIGVVAGIALGLIFCQLIGPAPTFLMFMVIALLLCCLQATQSEPTCSHGNTVQQHTVKYSVSD